MGILIKGMVVVLGCVLLCFLAGQVFRNMRRLDRRIEEFQEEIKEQEEQGRIVPPYVAMAQLYADTKPEPQSNKSKKRKR